MKLPIFPILILCSGLLSSPAFGQTETLQTPPPKSPLLARAPELSSWTIVESLAGQKPATESTGDKEARISITKTGTTYRETSTVPGRGEETKWVMDGMQIKLPPGGGRPIRIPRTKFSSEFSDYTRSDFEPFEWITRETYKGVEKYENRICYVFEVESGKKRLTPRERHNRSQIPSDTEKPPDETQVTSEPSHTLTAYLDVATQLPVALREGERLTTYTFNPPPTAPLSPPADVLENFAKWREAIQSRNRPPPRP